MFYIIHWNFLDIEDFANSEIVEESLFNWTTEATENTALSYNAIKADAIESEVLHMDETAVNREEYRKWLHVACIPELTYLAFHTGRGCEAMNEIGIVPNFYGTAIHDM